MNATDLRCLPFEDIRARANEIDFNGPEFAAAISQEYAALFVTQEFFSVRSNVGYPRPVSPSRRGSARAACGKATCVEERIRAAHDMLDVVQFRTLNAAFVAFFRSLPSKRLCMPNLPMIYPQTTLTEQDAALSFRRRLSARAKVRLSLAGALLYGLARCRKQFKGFLLPLVVEHRDAGNEAMARRTHSGPATHANLVVVDFGAGSAATCYLFEPNGTDFAKIVDGLPRVQRAWAEVCATLRRVAATDRGDGTPPRDGHLYPVPMPEVVLAGGEGIQMLLGWRKVNNKVVRMGGYPICGAVTFWVVQLWVEACETANSTVSFSEFETLLERELCENESPVCVARRKELKLDIFFFVRRLRETLDGSREAIAAKLLVDQRELLDEITREQATDPRVACCKVTVSVKPEKPVEQGICKAG